MDVPRTKALPETESAVEDAFPNVVWPTTLNVPFEVRAVANVPLVPKRLVAKKLVEVPLVMTELEAKMFWAKRFKKRNALVPSDREISVVGRMSPAWKAVPVTVKLVVEAFARFVCPETVN